MYMPNKLKNSKKDKFGDRNENMLLSNCQKTKIIQKEAKEKQLTYKGLVTRIHKTLITELKKIQITQFKGTG